MGHSLHSRILISNDLIFTIFVSMPFLHHGMHQHNFFPHFCSVIKKGGAVSDEVLPSVAETPEKSGIQHFEDQC